MTTKSYEYFEKKNPISARNCFYFLKSPTILIEIVLKYMFG